MRKSCLVVGALLVALTGCGGKVLTINDAVSPVATQNLDAGQSLAVTAKVFNDPAAGGVSWSLIGAGTLANQTTSSVLYVAPATVAATSYAAVTATPVNNSLFGAATQIVLAPAPAITTSALNTATVGTAYSQQLASSGGFAPYTFTLLSGALPAGLGLSATGQISGTPASVGTFIFTVQMADSASTSFAVTKLFSIMVAAPVLSVASSCPANGVSGTTVYSFAFTASGGAPPNTWSLYSGNLPAGLSLSSAGVLSGIPLGAGSSTFTVQVADTESVPQTARKTCTLVIYTPLKVSTSTLPDGSLKNVYSATLASTGGTSQQTWSITSGSLPAGLSLSPAGVITGTPTTVGSSTFTVQVSDNSSPVQTATTTLTLKIVLSTLAITTTSLPQATIAVAYSTSLQSSGGNPPVSWSQTSGSLPAGLTLSAAGVISGTTTAVAGTYTFTVQATDATPASVTQQLSLTVVGLATLSVTTTTLSAGNLDTPYSATLAATGGAVPYAWSLSSGSLPTGLSLSSAGVISGTPLTAGSFAFVVQVKDSQATPATATRSLTLVIGRTLPAGAGNALLSGSYAFLMNGYSVGTGSGKVFGFGSIGSLTADGAGNVIGVEDLNTASGVQTSLAVSGTYTLNASGRGFLVLTVASNPVVCAIQASNKVAGVAQNIALIEFDNAAGATGSNNGSGFAYHQTTGAFAATTFQGTFAFGLSGESACSTCATPAPHLGPIAAAGNFTGNGVSTLATGSEDATDYGTNYSGVTLAGTFTAPSTSTGRGTLVLTPVGTIFSGSPTTYTYVIVNGSQVLLMSNSSHATSALLFGEARLQQITTYTAASLTGVAIGYESQANGGNGSTTLPADLNAVLYSLTFTGSGTGTLAQDSNRLGVVATSSAAVTYTTATNGRTSLVTGGTSNQVLYSYAANAGYALDLAVTASYGALITYEGQLLTTAPLPPYLSGTYAVGTVFTPTPATDVSGAEVVTLNMGGVNTLITGQASTSLDFSSPTAGVSQSDTSGLVFSEDLTGKTMVSTSAGATPQATVYSISRTRAVSIPATAGTAPVISLLVQ